MTGHVKFVEDAEESVHNGAIKMEVVDNTTVRCILGFLQCYHKYSLELEVPVDLDGAFTPSPLQPFSLVVEKLQVNGNRTATSVVLSLTVGNLAGTVEDELIFTKDGVQTIVILHANILGQEEGTPYLKTGIRMLAHLHHSDAGSSAQ